MKLQLLGNLEIMRDYDAYVIPFTSEVTLSDFFDEDFKNMLQPYIDSKLFEGKKEQLYSFTSFYKNSSKHVHIILIGLGDADKLSNEIAMNAYGKAIKELQRLKAKLPIVMY